MHQGADCAFMEVGSEDIFGRGIATPNQQITFGILVFLSLKDIFIFLSLLLKIQTDI